MRKEAKALHQKAVDSLVLAVGHFNSPWDRGRAEATLIMLDRAFELLLKAVIVHRGGGIREKDKSLTIGFDQCLRKCFSDAALKCLSDDDVVTLQNLNSLRDAAQHYLVEVSEEQLYIYAQAAVSLFGRLVNEAFGIPLSRDVPERVLPVAARPPRDLGKVLDAEFAAIKDMVAPGSRRRLDAKAKLRAFAILESSLEGKKTQPDDRELDAALKRIQQGETWRDIFPGVATLRIDPDATGPGIALRITKNQGEAVALVPEGAEGATVIAVKRVNELDYYSLGMKQLSKKLGLTQQRALLLVDRFGIQNNADYFKEIRIGSQVHKRYSRPALERLHDLKREVDLDALWAARNQRTKEVETAA